MKMGLVVAEPWQKSNKSLAYFTETRIDSRLFKGIPKEQRAEICSILTSCECNNCLGYGQAYSVIHNT